MQAKLLQVIQDKEVRAIGAVDFQPVDFRIICATNRNLKYMVDHGQFRLDLYYRLNVLELMIPPLRERPDDIPLLTNYFLEKFNRSNTHSPEKHISNEVMQIFTYYS